MPTTTQAPGPVEMAQAEMDAGSDVLGLELATDVATGQLAEIQRKAGRPPFAPTARPSAPPQLQ